MKGEIMLKRYQMKYIAGTSKRFWSFFSFKCKKKPIPDKVTYNGVSFSNDRL